ncbi:MAG TPA: ATP synthase subunit I [Methylophilaceae bacterium]|nr:ATP synthase subunit I [Methylophilaceae bacterium]
MNDTTTISRAFGKAARWQGIVTALVAVLAYVLSGKHASISVVAGGFAVMLGGFAGMAIARRKGATAGSALIVLLKAEAVKIAVIALVLLGVFKFYEGLVPLALIGGLACAALISGAALKTLDEE